MVLIRNGWRMGRRPVVVVAVVGVEGAEVEPIDEMMQGVGERAGDKLGVEVDRQQPWAVVDMLVSRHCMLL